MDKLPGRPRNATRERQRKEFVALLAAGVDPKSAAERSGHPAEKALQTLSELGFVLSVFRNDEQKAA